MIIYNGLMVACR